MKETGKEVEKEPEPVIVKCKSAIHGFAIQGDDCVVLTPEQANITYNTKSDVCLRNKAGKLVFISKVKLGQLFQLKEENDK